MNNTMRFLVLGAALGLATPVIGQNVPTEGSVVDDTGGVPVFPYDIKDRPYQVLGTVHVGVRKATVFSKEASQAKVYQELWKHAKKLGADAVVSATYGDSHVTFFSWGTTNASGVAVRFIKADATQAAAPSGPATNRAAAPSQQH